MILGCTGSIGTTAMQSLDSLRSSFDIVAISAHKNHAKLLYYAQSFNVPNVCLSGGSFEIEETDGRCFYYGSSGLLDMIRNVECDVVLNAISGSAGLEPTFEILSHHTTLALANKESIVMGGDLFTQTVKKYGVTVYPVDSEHSTIDSLIKAHGDSHVDSVILTASGGPFRTFTPLQMAHITIEQALNHPTWNMGAKITIDSATLANKGLEVIEASYLFGKNVGSIDVVIHPQSVVHSFIRMKNGALYAQMSPPDMALPIMNALNGGHIELKDIVSPLDLSDLTLRFEKFDKNQFPLLDMAFHCLKSRKGYPIAFNGANETAVLAFLKKKISFISISAIVQEVLQHSWSEQITSIEDIYSVHRRANTMAQQLVERYRIE